MKSETGVWDPGYEGFGTQGVFIPIRLFRIHEERMKCGSRQCSWIPRCPMGPTKGIGRERSR